MEITQFIKIPISHFNCVLLSHFRRKKLSGFVEHKIYLILLKFVHVKHAFAKKNNNPDATASRSYVDIKDINKERDDFKIHFVLN